MNIERVSTLHTKLARRIKQYETVVDEVPPVQVLNEMRYALRSVLEMLEISSECDGESEELDHAEQKTYHALMCAYHDLIDGLALDLSVILDDLRKKYPEETVKVLGDKRFEIINFLDEVNAKIILSRTDIRARPKIYDEELYDRYFERFLEYRKSLTGEVIEDVVGLHVTKKKARRNHSKFILTRQRIAILAGATSLAIILLASLLGS